MKKQKIFVFSGAALFVLAGSLFGLGVARGGNSTDAQLLQVARGDLKITVSGSGNIQPSDDVTLTFGTSGRVDKINVEEGDQVRQGDALAELDTGALELALTQAKASLVQARVDRDEAEYNLNQLKDVLHASYDRVKVADSALDAAEEQIEAADKAVAEAQKQLDEATVTAPFDGVIAKVHVKEGDMIPFPNVAAAPVIRLVSYERMELLVEIDEMDIPYLKAGQEVTIKADPLPELEFAGEISTLFPVPREIGGVVVYEVKIKFDVPDDSGIRVGMNATARTTSIVRSNVLLIPNRALKEDSMGNPMVEVLVGDQIQEKRVSIGASNGFEIEVLSGLSEGDMVTSQL